MSKIFLTSTVFVALAGVTLLPAGGCTANDDHDEILGRVSSALGDGGDSDGGATPKRGDLVISQVYGGGGEVGATYGHDFVELLNRSRNTLSLNGLSLQYADATSDFSPGGLVPLVGSIPPGGYFLVKFGTMPGGEIPSEDQYGGSLELGLNSGKVALVPTMSALGCGGATRCSKAQLLDLVGYGAVSDFEGSQSALPLDATKAAIRKSNGCADTDDNRADFTSETPAPRNSATATNQCPAPPQKDAGTTGPTPPVVDPPLGAEDPYDAGPVKDAGAKAGGAGADTSGCSVGRTSTGSYGGVVLFGVGLILSVCRRKR